MDEIFLISGLIIMTLAFMAEYIDSSLGMGYGTTLTPLLLMMGYEPLEIVPMILLSELLTGGLAAILHSKAKNVDFDFRNDQENAIVKRLGKLGYMPKSRDSKVALILSVCSVFGTIIAVFVALELPKFYLKFYIGVLVLALGIYILARRNKEHKYSTKKIVGLGLLASFNKGMSGGGYGPLVTSGQVMSGMSSKNAIAITSFAESLTCLVGVLTYVAIGMGGAVIGWDMGPFLIIGALMSVPLSVYTVKKAKVKNLTVIIGVATVLLGAYTLINLYI